MNLKTYVPVVLWLMASAAGIAQEGTWTTSADRKLLLHHESLPDSIKPSPDVVIELEPEKQFQSIIGFGATLTDGSVAVIDQLEQAQRESLLDELFRPAPKGIGIGLLRISVGASDLSESPYTYNDSDTPDPQLSKFDFSAARHALIPMLLEAKSRNPNVQLMATPWSAPVWMKDNGRFVGGSLKPEYYEVYANYLVRYLQEMSAVGLKVDYLTVQNEPENAHNNPSMLMTAEQQATFIGEHLGPKLKEAGLTTRILAFDHNCDHPEYPMAVLNDRKAGPFVAGSAFHLYAGEIGALSQVQKAFPNKEIHFTEQWTSSDGDFGGDLMWHAENVLIGATKNWARSVLEWNLAADEAQKPHTPGGCDKCLGALTIDQEVQRNVAYYVIAHASKFIQPGAVRIGSTTQANLTHVAFLNPDGQLVMILLNKLAETQALTIKVNGKQQTIALAPRSLVTWVGTMAN